MNPTSPNALHTRLRAAWFGFRASGLRLRRGLRNLGTDLETLGAGHAERTGRAGGADLQAEWPVVAGASRTPLWRVRNASEWKLTAGKVQNLRVAARRLHGLLIPAGTVFSFWRSVGRPTRARGYAEGRELREGCMVASTGGGLCQLSNALYAAALEAGMEIVERHAHSKIVPGSLAERGLDATVFWNYIDLRFRVPADCLLEVALDARQLRVTLRLREPLPAISSPARAPALIGTPIRITTPADLAHDCIGCEQEDCAEFIAPAHHAGHTA